MTRAAMTLALLLGAAMPSAAQTSSPKFEVEVYGGLGRFLDAGAGTLSLPSAGAPITTSSPMAPSRRVPSWFFGDGATLLNDVASQLDLTTRMTPLDAVIAGIGRTAQNNTSMGARLRYRTAPKVWTELGVDVSSSTTSVPDSLMASVDTTRESFVATFSELLASGPFTNRSVTATATEGGGSWREVTASLAANIEFGSIAGVTPYATVGGGFVTRRGTQPSIALTGRYAAKILGSVPIDETDRVTVRGVARNAPAIIVGAGLARTIGTRLTFRVDARLVAANRTIGANIDAAPSVLTGTPADYIESFTNPSIQFSNNASTGRRSSLSGDALDHLDVARSTRLQTRGLVTVGFGFRF